MALSLIKRLLLALTVLSVFAVAAADESKAKPATESNFEPFLSLLNGDPGDYDSAFSEIEEKWHGGMIPMSLETLRFSNNLNLSERLIGLLQEKTGQDFGFNIDQWYRWLWSQPDNSAADYATFKSKLYRQIDPVFAEYFSADRDKTIRLDEVRWCGVLQDGIPPLRQPKMISVEDADYLEDDNIVFGVAINGDVRAYPKRILAWHEMFVDTIGGAEYAGVYCTLCGSVTLYETHFDGVRHELGTSGFLFRSNKLMYDKATQSLWSSTWGRPVIGPLVGQGIELKQDAVVTTTWGEWRRRHPDTVVLSLDTGHRRDYGEGVAYQQYFSTHRLMFGVPRTDDRLNNKDEVLALRFPETSETLAIDARFLLDNRVYHDAVGAIELVVLTDDSGANRVYATSGQRFDEYDGDRQIIDVLGQPWALSEDALTSADGKVFPRLPARRAFWFGWFAAFNETRLVM